MAAGLAEFHITAKRESLGTASFRSCRRLPSISFPEIVNFVAARRLLTMYPYRGYVEAGGLMSYAPSDLDQFRRAAAYVDNILKGAKPADLPVQEPIKFEFIINLKTAKALGITIPETLLATADEVIQ